MASFGASSSDPQIPGLVAAVRDLQASIERADSQSHRLNRTLLWLTVATVGLAIVQVVAAVTLR